MPTIIEKSYICGECGKAYRTANNLNSHMAVHSDERPFVCGVCSKAQVLLKYPLADCVSN